MPFLFTGFCFTLFQEGLTVVENRTAEIISENSKLHARRRGSDPAALSRVTNSSSPQQPFQKRADQETQLKASCDVRWQMCMMGSWRVHNLVSIFIFEIIHSPCLWPDELFSLFTWTWFGQERNWLLITSSTWANWQSSFSRSTGLLSDLAFNIWKSFWKLCNWYILWLPLKS